MDVSQYSSMDLSQKLHLTRKDFYKLLTFMNVQCLEGESSKFFDYLLYQKMFLYQKLYPHLQLKIETLNKRDTSQDYNAPFASTVPSSVITIPEKISYTDFLVFF